jgi:hypothetical protein
MNNAQGYLLSLEVKRRAEEAKPLSAIATEDPGNGG